MLTVSDDPDDVEWWLGEGALTCLGCGAVLTRLGWARPRRVRDAGTVQVELRPRRARCSGCAATHV